MCLPCAKPFSKPKGKRLTRGFDRPPLLGFERLFWRHVGAGFFLSRTIGSTSRFHPPHAPHTEREDGPSTEAKPDASKAGLMERPTRRGARLGVSWLQVWLQASMHTDKWAWRGSQVRCAPLKWAPRSGLASGLVVEGPT